MIALRSMAATLGGDVTGASVLCPGPGHSPRDRSLSVTLAPEAPDGFMVYSHAGDDWRECRAHVLDRLGQPAGFQPRARTAPSPASTGGDNSAAAKRLWADAASAQHAC
jgi:hypothetical protein